jgi:acetyl esterase
MPALDPQTQALINFFKAMNRPELCDLPVEMARTIYRDGRIYTQPEPPAVAEIKDFTIPGPGGSLPLRGYRPIGSTLASRLPALVFYHGGGFTIGDLESHDVLCRELCNQSGCAVYAVDYRMGPEHKFPAAVDDCWAATRWVVEHAATLNIDPARVAVGGDSAGGNLAAVVALLARDAKFTAIKFQLLIYPATDLAATLPSHQTNGVGYLLTNRVMNWFMSQYIGDAKNYQDWRASPLLAPSLKGVAPALVMTAGFDPLVDEGKAYADRLTREGVKTEYICYEGQVHGFITMGKLIAQANVAVSQCANALKAALAG